MLVYYSFFYNKKHSCSRFLSILPQILDLFLVLGRIASLILFVCFCFIFFIIIIYPIHLLCISWYQSQGLFSNGAKGMQKGKPFVDKFATMEGQFVDLFE
jgi:hypothetical protein